MADADFDRWFESQFAASGPFTALIILVKIEDTTIWPLGSSYATVIGSELRWAGMRRLQSAAWPHAAFGYRYPVSESARERTRIETRTVIASLRCMRLETASCARAFVHMRFPCPKGGPVGAHSTCFSSRLSRDVLQLLTMETVAPGRQRRPNPTHSQSARH